MALDQAPWVFGPQGDPNWDPRGIPNLRQHRIPDVAAMAYVPFRSQLDGAYEQFNRWARLGLRFLFLSGNEPPPPAFSGLEEFDAFVGLREFRAALALTDSTVYVDEFKRIQGVTFSSHTAIGFTPIRWQMLAPWLPWTAPGPAITRMLGRPKNAGFFRPIRLRTDWYEWWLSMRVPFKLGDLANALQFPFTRHLAPSAGMRLLIRFRNDGSWTVWLASTWIPSTHLYVNWANWEALAPNQDSCCHNMMTNTREQIDEFLFGQHCRLAPGETHCSGPPGIAPPDRMEWTWDWQDVTWPTEEPA